MTPQAAQEAVLQAELNQVLAQISQQQQALSTEQAKGETLQRDIDILNGQINEAQLSIKAHQLAIQALGNDITQKNQTIADLGDQINSTQQSLSQLIRETNELDSFSLTDVVLSGKSISDFFADVDVFNSLKQSIQIALGSIQQSQTAAQSAEQQLTQQQLEQIDAKISIQQEQAQIQASENQKAKLLSLSKQQQAGYQTVIAQQEAKAAAIRAALFSLNGTAAIPFGTALEYAQEAQQKTGVDPAFTLAILTQESNLGKNDGTCYLANEQTGAGIKVTTGALVYKVMNPRRDVPPFLQITGEFGLNPLQTRVSCPQGGGYGGAMGPAQFIASTWQLLSPQITVASGDNPPDPWNPKDAFFASAIYLGNLGGVGGSYSAERNAACKYYSGKACGIVAGASAYGNSVMALARSIQTNMINPLEGLGG
jgi:peptidoglycan hydrolase CwlO-like protein